jgi:hypothetical protein
LEQELGARELAARAWKGASSSRAVEAGAGPTWEQERDPGKHLTFFLLVSFIVSSSCCGAALQLHEEGDANNTVAFFFVLQKKKEATIAMLPSPSFFVFFLRGAAPFFLFF